MNLRRSNQSIKNNKLATIQISFETSSTVSQNPFEEEEGERHRYKSIERHRQSKLELNAIES